jgi:CRP-like cAMP-binding protein
MNNLPVTKISSPGIRRTVLRRNCLADLPEFCWQIESGIVRTLTWNESGETIVLGIWSVNDLVGSQLSTVTPYEMECLTDVIVKLIPQHQLVDLPYLMLNQIKRSDEFVKVVRRYRSDNLILSFLTWLANRFGQVVADGVMINFYITHQEIADTVGTTRVTCSRTISQLIECGKIKKRNRYYIIMFQ